MSLKSKNGAIVAVLLAVGLAACGRAPEPIPEGRPFEPASRNETIIAAAGDIACSGDPCVAQRDTADLLARINPDLVLALGDNQYEDGALEDYVSSYEPTWGRFKERTRPTPGNHDYHTSAAAGYFDYFGELAGPEPAGYYSYDLGSWHLVAINSGEGEIAEEQLGWIEADLAADGHRCEIAYWHHPRWSSGTKHGSDDDMATLWTTLRAAGVDVALNGHEHNYERFAPLDPDGQPDVAGIRQFVAGTGGAGNYEFGEPITGSEVRITDVHGVLELTLLERSYVWRFVSTGERVLDEGGGDCHT